MIPFASPLLRRLCFAAAVVMVFLLFYLGAKPIAVNLFPAPWDKLAHFVAYGAIAGLFALGMAKSQPLAPILLSSTIGALDEWHQVYLPGRSADIADFVTDVVAAVVVVTLVDWLRVRTLVGQARCRPSKDETPCAES